MCTHTVARKELHENIRLLPSRDMLPLRCHEKMHVGLHALHVFVYIPYHYTYDLTVVTATIKLP